MRDPGQVVVDLVVKAHIERSSFPRRDDPLYPNNKGIKWAADLFRTVKLSALPACTSIGKVLGAIHAGAIFSAFLYDTVALSGDLTAQTTFVEQAGATRFVDNAESDGFYIGSTQPQNLRPDIL
ncbi:hypothetical protein N7517_004970 [Penicillium concentricum]|uniref:Uncharacterized protein n=1 Tax=Penicillium concentricum TaxID=293559 RepID=A0A9W9S980_9EURO|nr:uncharacterized protein N7517_004970 [Penicillium concentricum]KAJ5372964.1 hypothetical protein N7517_004970 [Penicillium concentricum]